MMKTSTNKKAYDFLRAYLRATDTSVLTAYGRCSTYKINAENEIRQRMLKENGHGYKVLSHNTFGFTCGYIIPTTEITEDINGNTEVHETNILVVDTKDNTYRIICDEVYKK